MDEQTFDRLTATLSSGTGRRRAIAGMVAGTAAILGRGASTTAKTGGKKCDRCPQRACCACLDQTCTLITGTDQNAIIEECQAFCGANNFNAVNLAISGLANFCAFNGTCTLVACPVPV